MSWTDRFFGKYYLKTHQYVIDDEKTQKEVDFIISTLNLPEKSSILDVPCGHGRHAIYLAKQGFEVTGVDNQADFIKLAKENSKELSNISFNRQDMREIDYHEQFDAVINMFTSFGYFTENENFQFLKKLAQAVKPGGKLLMETVNREWALQQTGPVDQAWMIYPPDNLTFIANNEFDLLSSRMISSQAIIEKGERYEQYQDIRLYTYTEMKLFLNQLGMTIIDSFGNFDRSAYTPASAKMIILVQKAA